MAIPRSRHPAERSVPRALTGPPSWHTVPVAQLPNLRVGVCTDVAHAIVRLDGELDITSSGPLVQHLSGLLSRGYTQIVIDLTHLVFCDAAGLGALVRAGRLAAARGGWLRLASTQPRLVRIMNLAHLTGALPGYQTTQDALAG